MTLRQLALIDAHGLGMHGGALRLVQGHARLTDVRLENSWAQLGGGALALYLGSTVDCSQCQFVSNMAGHGGAIWVGDSSSRLKLSDSLVYYNAADRGGGLYIVGGSATISRSTFSQNVAGVGQGADILSIGGLVTIDANTAIDPGGIVHTSA